MGCLLSYFLDLAELEFWVFPRTPLLILGTIIGLIGIWFCNRKMDKLCKGNENGKANIA